MPVRRFLALFATLGVLLAASACGADDGEDSGASPAELRALLSSAHQRLDAAAAFTVSVSASHVPDDINVLKSARGRANRSPAFSGTLRLSRTGSIIDAKVVAVDAKVWATLYGTTFEVRPAQYGAPDPARIVEGFLSVLAATHDLHEEHAVRESANVLRVVTGVVSGSVVHRFVPSAEASGRFAVTYRFAHDGTLQDAVVKGPFYAGHTVSYTFGVTPLDSPVTIRQPR